jgi:hypothetical protein
MQNLITTFLTLSLLLIVNITHAQGKKDTTRYLYKPEWKETLKQTPADAKRWQDFELHARMYAKYAVPEEKTLPIVFNLIHVGGEVKVTKEDISSQLQVLNDAFAGNLKGESNKIFESAVAGDSKIRFCLGSPQGKQDGIYTISKSTAYDFASLSMISDKKSGLEGAKKDEYINVWVTELPDELGGFAILPGHDEVKDGIYIDPDFFGVRRDQKYYHSGKTLVHLMGQYLGLQALWTNGDCQDDGVEDTPVHNAPNITCFGEGHISLCYGYPMEMVGNFMDSNPDDCASYFTKGQVARMHATLGDLGYRKNLLKGVKLCDSKIDENEETPLESRNVIDKLDFNLVPNPAQNSVEVFLFLPNTKAEIKVEVYNSLNQIMHQQGINAFGEHKGIYKINTTSYPNGNYYVTIRSGNEVATKTLICLK